MLAAGGLALPFAAWLIEGSSLGWSAAGTLAAAAGAACAWKAARRDARESLLAAWLVGFSLAALAAQLAIVPALDARESFGGVSRQIGQLVPPNRTIYSLGADETTRGMIPLYAGRPLSVIPSVEDLEKLVAKEGEVYLVTVDKRDRKPAKIDLLQHLSPTVLLEDLREGFRGFRLLLIRTAAATPAHPAER